MTKAMTSTFDLSLLLHAAAAETGRFVTGDVRWMPAEPDDLRVLTDSDRELLGVVTGEHFARDTASGKPGTEPSATRRSSSDAGSFSPGYPTISKAPSHPSAHTQRP